MGFRTFFLFIFFLLTLTACGNRFDISTERGRQSMIDEANLYLSAGNCQLGLNAIDPLYNSSYVTDEVRVIRASVDACFGGFVMISLLANIVDKPNIYQALAKTMQVTLGDGKITALYRAVDILTSSNTVLSAGLRSHYVNNFIMFLQLGIIGAIVDAYGNGTTDGAQTTALDYLPAAAGTLSNLDACAIAAAHSAAIDSFRNSDLASNTQAARAVASFEVQCQALGLSSCTSINRDRTLCDGANAASLTADALVGNVDSAW